MQIVFDFMAGDVPFDEFWTVFRENPEVRLWVDQLSDFQSDPPPQITRDSMLRALYRATQNVYNGHILGMLEKDVQSPEYKHIHNAIKQYCIFSTIETAILAAYPDTKCSRRYKQNREYYDKALGRSIGGNEVMGYAASILDQFPVTMKAVDRLKAGKEALWAAFHIKDRKFPRWAQEADWPMGKNSPMEYLGQRRDGELVALRFRDVDTGEIRVVEQFY